MNTIAKFFLGIIIFSAILLNTGTATAGQYPDFKGTPDLMITQNTGLDYKIIDLRDYASDPNQNAGEMFYEIVSQTNNRLVDCYLDDKYFVTCGAPKKDSIGENTIKARVTNAFGLSDDDSFTVNVVEQTTETGTTCSLDRNDVVIEPGDSINVTLTIENNNKNKETFDISTYLDNDERKEIKATPAMNEVTLNAGEKTSFSITITSFKDARAGSHTVDLKCGEHEDTINVDIEDETPIDVLRVSDYYVCKEPYTQEIGIRLENNSSRTQTIELDAEHELLLPIFEFRTTTLASGESDEFALRIHTNQATANTEYTIPIFARSEKYFVERDITFRIVDCADDEFDLIVKPSEITLDRGETDYFTVKLRSNSNDGQYVRLSTESDIPTKLEEYKVFLPAHGETSQELEVKARDTDADGTHKVKVYAWNSKETEEETVKVKIRPEHDIELIIGNNNFDARVCSANHEQVYEITVKNNGDFDEEVELSLDNSFDYVQARASKETITVDAGSEKIIYVFVTPSFSAPLGNHTIYLEAETDNQNLREALNFRIVESEIMQTGAIKVTGYPTDVEVEPGKDKLLTFTIKNPTNEDIESVKITLYGLGNGVNANAISIGTLEAGQEETLRIRITAEENAKEKIYPVTLEVKGKGNVTTKNIMVKVTKEPTRKEDNNEAGGFLAGLITLGGFGPIMLGVILLIVLVAIIIMLSLLNSNKSEDLNYYNKGA